MVKEMDSVSLVYPGVGDNSNNRTQHYIEINPLMGTLKLQTNGPLYSNTVIGRLAVDGWAVTLGTAMRGLRGLGPRPVPSSLYQT